jgi:glyoxylase I family protein
MQFIIEHIGLAAHDTVALKDWYVRVLGAEITFDSGENPPAFFLKLAGTGYIEIYQAQNSIVEVGNNRLAGWRHLALRVPSIESARDQLIGRGVEFTDPIKPAGGGGRVLFFKDIEGNLLHLVERPVSTLFTL